jgi:hypothetical protein
MRPALGALALVVVAATSGCPQKEYPDEIQLYTMTVAPPARAATMVNGELEHSVTMSRGVALAIGCWDTCKGSCVGPTFTVADPAIAEVRPVFRSAGGYPTWVVIAKAAGSTELKVANGCAERVYGLTVADDQQ